MRLFVAVELDDAARQAFAAEQRRLKQVFEKAGDSALKWVQPTHVHLTIAFLEEVKEDRAALVAETMRQPISVDPFEVVFGGLGVFPSHGAPRVLWLGLTQGVRQLLDVHRQVVDRLGRLGIVLEDRQFHPHLTLARWRAPQSGARQHLTRAGGSEHVARIEVSAVSLIQSRLLAAGPTYTTVCAARLGSDASPPLQSR